VGYNNPAPEYPSQDFNDESLHYGDDDEGQEITDDDVYNFNGDGNPAVVIP
jgi:hypothetical protein